VAKVFLIHPYVPMELQYGSKYRWAGAVLPPLGILYVAAVLEKAGHRTELLDANALQIPAADVVKRVLAGSPDVVGMTGTSLSFNENLEIARRLKEAQPSLPIVLGGVHAQGSPDVAVSYGCFDYVVPNEGELTMLELVEALEGGVNPRSSVEGLYYLEGDKPVSSGTGKLVDELDDLPFPARHLLSDMTIYHQKSFGYRLRPHTTMFTQRGCPYRCTFCSSSKQFREVFNKKIRAHSVDYVKEEIAFLQKTWGIREIYFVDDTFNLRKKRVHELCDMMMREFPGLKWSCNFEANICDEDLLKHMRQAGCWLIQMGVETGNPDVMKVIDKGITLDQVRLSTEMAARLGFAIKTSFIIGNPTETQETIEETIQFAQSLPVHYVTFSMMAPLPGTYFWNTADDYGVFDRVAYDKFSMASAAFVPHGLSADFLKQKQQEAHRRVYLRLDMVRRHLKMIRSFQDVMRYSKGAATLVM
jgi:anaerobic magnesium-protoporphyrin IX monomethyl ester cyclase